jgi:hypothetical protein
MSTLEFSLRFGLALLIVFGPIVAFVVLAVKGRRIMRRLGVKCHVFKTTHRSGSIKRCIHCHEEQQEYQLGWGYRQPSWWETTADGNGNCAEKPLPTRMEWY